jgi:hypothetical protein
MIGGIRAMRDNNQQIMQQMAKTLEEEESVDNQMR